MLRVLTDVCLLVDSLEHIRGVQQYVERLPKRSDGLRVNSNGVRVDAQQIKELLDMAIQLEGLARSAGTHAAGVVVSDRPIEEYVPLQTITWDYAPTLGHYVRRTWFEGRRQRKVMLSAALPGKVATPALIEAVLARLAGE